VDDDVTWTLNTRKKLLVSKCDMLVSFTDVSPGMTPAQIASKAMVSSVSDLAAKGVKPSHCLVSIGLPERLSTRSFVGGLAQGFREAEKKYKLKILGGDTNATSSDVVIDVLILGYSDKVIPRNEARPGDLVAVSGDFGLQSAGLLILSGKAKSTRTFKAIATKSVLRPRARLDLRNLVARRFASCIDSSDGLALSLYHLAESSKVDIELNRVPVANGVEEFAANNKLSATELALFGGEEYELVFTFDPVYAEEIKRQGLQIIGEVGRHVPPHAKPAVTLDSKKIPRRGWVHFASH
ncbi:MAG: thiamine-phosphate kinase, partial [Nitrososphaerota archaeon]|nr:thiamine-phosphate kinase [Nitrososphaerota archaeon]